MMGCCLDQKTGTRCGIEAGLSKTPMVGAGAGIIQPTCTARKRSISDKNLGEWLCKGSNYGHGDFGSIHRFVERRNYFLDLCAMNSIRFPSRSK